MTWSWWQLCTLVGGVMAAIWLYWRWSNRRLLELAAQVPGPPALPLVGNALLFMSKPEEVLHVINSLIMKYGRYVKFWLGPDLNIVVMDPTDIRYLLTSNKVNQKGPVYDFMKKIIGPGILTGGPTWRLHRKIATPSYNKKSVIHYAAIFNREADALVQELIKKNPGDTYNVYLDVLEATTQSVCQTLMGLSKKDTQSLMYLKEVIMQTQNMYSLIFNKMTRWWLQIPIVFRLLGEKKREDYYMEIMDALSDEIVQKRKWVLENTDYVMTQEEQDDKIMGIVDRYILSGELNDQELKWETLSLFTTSQEASAKIASAVLLFLAHLPDWQAKVYKEIIDELGPEDDAVTDEQLRRLRHLDMVYKEALRYLSIAAMFQRTVEQEVAIDNGKLIIPRGTSLVIPLHHLHRNPQYWPEPQKVDPGRFLPENIAKRDPNAFVPFSLGAMDCLGRVYATALIKTLVVKVVRRLELEADGRLEDLDIHVAISVRFSKGYNLRSRPRSTVKAG